MVNPAKSRARARGTAALIPVTAAAVVVLGCAPAVGPAQQPAPQPAPAQTAAKTGPTVGMMAPDFSLPAATRFGRTAAPFQLSQYRGQTIVLAFFSRARTRG